MMMMMIVKTETKKTMTLFLVELLAAAWLPCILEHPVLSQIHCI